MGYTKIVQTVHDIGLYRDYRGNSIWTGQPKT